MYSTRDIQTRVVFNNPNDIYGDQENNVLRVLRNRYENKCYMSCFVVEITEILQLGQLIFSRQKIDGSAVCNVHFRVRCIIIKKNDILHDCKVIKINKHGHILCKNQHAVIYINKHKALQTIREGQVILAIAGVIKYKPLTPSITVCALPFIPIVNPTTRYVLNITASNTVDILLDKLAEETKINSELDSKINTFFTELLYPYAKKRINQQEISFTDVRTRNGQIILSQPDWLPIGPNLIVNDKKNLNPLKTEEIQESKSGDLVITENYENIMGYFIHKHIEQLLTIRKLCTTYNTMEAINANANLWNIYTRNRIV
jgi:hypothetical protein